MSDWKPIETAPKDGTTVDLWVVFDNGNSGRVENASFEDGVWWADHCGSLYSEPEFTPTHWMALPKPPKEED